MKQLHVIFALASVLSILLSNACAINNLSQLISTGPDTFEELCAQRVKSAEKRINKLELFSRAPSINNFLAPFDAVLADIDALYGHALLTANVHPEQEVRERAERCQRRVNDLRTQISLSHPLYERLASINTGADPQTAKPRELKVLQTLNLNKEDKDEDEDDLNRTGISTPSSAVAQAEQASLDEVELYLNRADDSINDSALATTQRYIELLLRDFRRSGVNLNPRAQTDIRKLQEEILDLGQQFSRHIREDVRYVNLHPKQLLGLPQDYIAALPRNPDNTLRVSTEYPQLLPFLKYAKDDRARLSLYRQFLSRGYPPNKKVLAQLIIKRHQLARRLGYPSYADYVAEPLMVKNADNIEAFIERVSALAEPRMRQDYQAMLSRLQQINSRAKQVGNWQKAYLQELIKNENYALDSRELRRFFSYQSVRDGLFALTAELFEVEIRPREIQTWHKSVEAYSVHDNQDQLIGHFFLDMHPRPGKYKHAAHFTLQAGIQDKRPPISALVCNFPQGQAPMEHSQVETFAHEFGHLLHSLFAGKQRWSGFSGIATEHDFVETPSQLFEEWAWNYDILSRLTINQQGQPIPPETVAKMNAARYLTLGTHTRNQMFYAALSLNYYKHNPRKIDLDKMLRTLQKRYSPFAYIDKTYFYANFGHLYGYSAVYYTYMWSLVIAADILEQFHQSADGLLDKASNRRFRDEILVPGGTRDAAVLTRNFLGRDYDFEAFKRFLLAAPQPPIKPELSNGEQNEEIKEVEEASETEHKRADALSVQ